MRRFAHSLLLLLVLALPAIACGDDDELGPNGEQLVGVKDNSFDPGSKTVSVGATVLWQWSGANQHNVTWVVASTNSATQTTGSFSRTFSTAGSYVYFCTIHGSASTGMMGTIVVQ